MASTSLHRENALIRRSMEYAILHLLGWHAAPMFFDGTSSRYGVKSDGTTWSSPDTTGMEEGWNWKGPRFGSDIWVKCSHQSPPLIPPQLRERIKTEIAVATAIMNERIVR